MSRAQRLGLALFVLLALAVSALATRVARHLEQGGAARLELGRLKPTALSPRTVACLEGLQERVLVTYYVSPAAAMPAAMRRMRVEVTDLLEALATRFPERFAFQVVDPEGELAGFAARRRIAPFRVRSVSHDAWDERTVWSTLALAFGARPETLLDGLGPEHLPHLQELLVGWLEELQHPRSARIALASPRDEPGFEELAEALGEHGVLTRVDLDAGDALPEADVLFWMHPRRASGETLRGLERLLATGAGVVIAGQRLEPREEVREGAPLVSFRRAPSALEELAQHFGLASEPGLVLDTNAEALDFESGKLAAAHWIRCIAPAQDFHRFASQPNGTLLFRAPAPFTPVPARLGELGLTAEVLATSSDESWLVREPPAEPVPLASLAETKPSGETDASAASASEAARKVAKQALLVALRPDHPWHGELFFAASETPFADGFFHREHCAHGRLLEVLLAETTASERLVLTGVDLETPAPLPPLSARARLAWRVFGIGLPILLVLALVHGRALLAALGSLGSRLARSGRRALVPLGALALALGLVRGLRAGPLDLGLDLSADGMNQLAPAARALAERAAAGGPIRATLVLSEAGALPPALRAPARELEARLADFTRAGAPLELERLVPEDLDPAALEGLAAKGIVAHTAASEDEGVRHVARFRAALRLERDGNELLLDFPDARAFERLEFRLALALERLSGRAVPRIAFASDIPRLSAAEAYEYQKKSLFAPGGTDVFALARAALERNDLTVVHVNPRAPVLPEHSDVLVWLQPRRSIEPMLPVVVRSLHGGGKVVVAAQHFKILAQQFRGGSFEPQLWPQPQNPDLERLYFPELGIELVREVLFDALCVPIAAESQVTGRQGTPDFERQDSALPFQIRLSAAGYADHPLMRGLGDQAFLWANRVRWDAARLAALGLSATVLATTSPRTWSYAWTGGWIPHELLAGPAELEKSSGSEPLGPQPLVVLFQGDFPKPTGPLELTSPVSSPAAPEEGASPAAPEEAPWPPSAPGQLVLIGDSTFLENESLASDEFRGDQLLWNLVAGLAFDGELRELATRARTPRGFGLVEPRTRLLGRAAVIGAGPLLLVFGVAVWTALRRRAPGTGHGARP